MIMHALQPAQARLLHVIDATYLRGFGFGPDQGGQEQPSQDGDDSNDHQELDQSKSTRSGL